VDLYRIVYGDAYLKTNMTTDQVTTWSLNKAKFSGIIGLLWAHCTVSK